MHHHEGPPSKVSVGVGVPPNPPSMPSEDIAAVEQSGVDWVKAEEGISEAAGRGDYEAALALAQATLESLRAEVSPRLEELTAATSATAQLQEYLNEDQLAAELWREALVLAARPEFPDPLVQPDILSSLSLNLLRQSGGLRSPNRAEAKRCLNAALGLYAEAYDSFPGRYPGIEGSELQEMKADARISAIETLKAFSEACASLHLRKAAEHFAEKACQLSERVLDQTAPLAFKARWNLMNAAREMRHYAYEEQIIRSSLHFAGAPASELDTNHLILQSRLADCLVRQKKFSEALAVASPFANRLGPPESLDELAKSSASFFHQALGAVAASLKDWPEAKRHFARAIQYDEARESISLGFLNGLQFSLARAYIKNAALSEDPEVARREEADAELLLKSAAALTDHESVGASYEGIKAHRKLLEFYMQRERYVEADQQAVILQQLCKLVHGSESEGYVNSFQWRSDVQAKMGRYWRSEELSREALSIALKLPNDSQDCIVNIYWELGGLASESGADAIAREYLQEAVEFAMQLRGPSSELVAEARLKLADELLRGDYFKLAKEEADLALRNLERFPETEENLHQRGCAYHVLGCCVANTNGGASEQVFAHYEMAEEKFQAAGSRNTIEYAYFSLDHGFALAARFDTARDPDDLAAALKALGAGESFLRKYKLHICQAHLEVVAKIVELFEANGNDESAGQYRDLIEEIRAKLGPGESEDDPTEDIFG